MSFKDELDARVAKVNDLLEGVLKIDAGLAEPLMEAMRYSVFSPGKRLRPIIMEETAALFDRDAKELPYFMAALELIHSYSLVHDDMPCMDNDEFRRGRKTTHAEYGEDIALLALEWKDNGGELTIRSPLRCGRRETGHICSLCYGADLAMKPYDKPYDKKQTPKPGCPS